MSADLEKSNIFWSKEVLRLSIVSSIACSVEFLKPNCHSSRILCFSREEINWSHNSFSKTLLKEDITAISL